MSLQLATTIWPNPIISPPRMLLPIWLYICSFLSSFRDCCWFTPKNNLACSSGLPGSSCNKQTTWRPLHRYKNIPCLLSLLQIIIRVMACDLVMAWSWTYMLGTEARNQEERQRKAFQRVATPPVPSLRSLGEPPTHQGCSCFPCGLSALLCWNP